MSSLCTVRGVGGKRAQYMSKISDTYDRTRRTQDPVVVRMARHPGHAAICRTLSHNGKEVGASGTYVGLEVWVRERVLHCDALFRVERLVPFVSETSLVGEETAA